MVQNETHPGLRPRPSRALDSPKVLERKREILSAAARLFRARGIAATGMREIAAALGMTAGNLYYYFENKGELLAFCQQEGLDGLLDLAQRVRRLELPSDQRLYLLLVGHVELVNETTPGSVAHLEIEALDETHQRALLRRRAEYEAALRELIAHGIREGRFRETNAKTAALALLGALNWTVKWYRPEGGLSAREIGRDFAEILVRGLLAPGVELTPPPLEQLLPREESA